MQTKAMGPSRGRPRTITRERLTDAAIATGLPKVTVVGLAADLGVSPKAIYKHFDGLEAIKQLIAEEIFLRWQLPALPEQSSADLASYMTQFSVSMWELVEQHPGIAPYMLRKDMVTPAMMARMQSHQEAMAHCFGLSFAQANWLLFTVAYYCVAVTDTVLPFASDSQASPSETPAPCDDETPAEYELRVRYLYAQGSRALITGALAILNEIKEN